MPRQSGPAAACGSMALCRIASLSGVFGVGQDVQQLVAPLTPLRRDNCTASRGQTRSRPLRPAHPLSRITREAATVGTTAVIPLTDWHHTGGHHSVCRTGRERSAVANRHTAHAWGRTTVRTDVTGDRAECGRELGEMSSLPFGALGVSSLYRVLAGSISFYSITARHECPRMKHLESHHCTLGRDRSNVGARGEGCLRAIPCYFGAPACPSSRLPISGGSILCTTLCWILEAYHPANSGSLACSRLPREGKRRGGSGLQFRLAGRSFPSSC